MEITFDLSRISQIVYFYPMQHTFQKSERLSSRTEIGILFDEGESVKTYPMKMVWRKTTYAQEFPIQVMFSVSKRNFKSAVKRNRIKRQLREVYRTNKHLWYPKVSDRCAIAIIYTGREFLSTEELEHRIKKLFNRFFDDYKKVSG